MDTYPYYVKKNTRIRRRRRRKGCLIITLIDNLFIDILSILYSRFITDKNDKIILSITKQYYL